MNAETEELKRIITTDYGTAQQYMYKLEQESHHSVAKIKEDLRDFKNRVYPQNSRKAKEMVDRNYRIGTIDYDMVDMFKKNKELDNKDKNIESIYADRHMKNKMKTILKMARTSTYAKDTINNLMKMGLKEYPSKRLIAFSRGIESEFVISRVKGNSYGRSKGPADHGDFPHRVPKPINPRLFKEADAVDSLLALRENPRHFSK